MKLILRGNTMDGGEGLLRLKGDFPHLDATIEENHTRNLRGELVSVEGQPKAAALGSLASGVAGAVIAAAVTKATGLS